MASLAMVWDLIARDSASPTFTRVAVSADKAAVSTERAALATDSAAASAGKSLGMLGKLAGALGAIATIDIAAHLVKDASSFQRQMLLIQTQAGASATEVANMSKEVLNLAGPVGQAPEELAKSLYHMESVGLRGKDALNALTVAAKGAKVGHADLEETTNALTSTVASGIPGVKNLEQAMGVLNATVGAGDMSLSNLNDALGSGLLTVVKGYGLNIKDVGAALATFGDNNIRGADAATMLRMGVQALAVPVKNGAAILDELGVNTGTVNENLAKLGLKQSTLADDMASGGLNKALTDLRDHLKNSGVDAVHVGDVLTQTFGKKAGPGLAVLLAQFDRLQTKYGDVNKGADNFASAWDATRKSASFAFDSLKSSVEAIGIKIGTKLLPYVTRAASGLAHFFSDAGKNQTLHNVARFISGTLTDAFHGVMTVLDGLKAFWDDNRVTIEHWARIVAQGVVAAVRGLTTALRDVGKWISDHKTLVESLAVGIGAVVLAWELWTGAIAAWALITKIAAAVQVAFNAVMDANPIMLVVLAIAGLAAGLVYAYKHSETFRTVVQTVFHAVAAAGKWLWETILKPTFEALKTAWGVVWTAIKAAWNFAEPIFATIGKVVYAVIGVQVLGIMWALRHGWDLLWGFVKWNWNTIGKPIFHAIASTASWLWDTVIGPIWRATKLGCDVLWAGVQTAWDTVGKPVFDAIGSAISWVWEKVVKPTFDAISTAWGVLWGGLSGVFSDIWDGVKSAIVDGINGIINVINLFITGINTILSKLPGGLKISLISPIGSSSAAGAGRGATDTRSSSSGQRGAHGFADGGVLPGYTPGRDVHTFWSATGGTLNLSGGEGILVPEAVRALGGASAIQSINSTFSNRVPGGGGSFAGGGMFYPQMFALVQKHFPEANLNSGFRPGASDYHGRGQAVDLGHRGVSGGDGNSYLAAMNTWLYDTYGKGTAELIYDGLGDNRPDLKNGRAMNYGPATSAQHHNHVHWALDSLAALGSGGASSGGGITGFISGLVSKITGAALGVFESPARAAIGKIPAGVLHDVVSGVFEKVDGALRSFVDGTGSAQQATSGPVGDHVGLIQQALKLAGVADSAAIEAAVNLIVTRESGWNPNAINRTDSNARAGHPSQGLMQTVPSTFAAWRLPSLSSDITDPLANLVAGIRYAVARYGSLLDVPGVADVNGGGSYVGYDGGGMLMPGVTPAINLTGKPEAVLTNDEWQVLKTVASGGGQQAAVFHLHDSDGVLLGTIKGEARRQITRSDRGKALAGQGGSARQYEGR